MKSHLPGERPLIGLAGRQDVGLEVVDLLEPVFKGPEIAVTLGKRGIVALSYQRLQRAPLSQKRFPAAVKQLQGLRKKFYLPYAAVSPFYVPLLECCVDPSLQPFYLVDRTVIEIFSIHERPDRLDETMPES